MKKIFTVLLVIFIGFAVWNAIQTKPDAATPEAVVTDVVSVDTVAPVETPKEVAVQTITKTVDNAKVAVTFKGFGPGKVHVGSFSKITSNLSLDDKSGLAGKITIDMNSMTSDSEKLTGHLKTADFFDVTKYPTAVFTMTTLTGADAQGGTVSGVMTIKGISKSITVPFTTVKSADASTVTGYRTNFALNLKDFGINQAFANETIELDVVVPLQ